MSPMDWATRPLKKYAEFSGREHHHAGSGSDDGAGGPGTAGVAAIDRRRAGEAGAGWADRIVDAVSRGAIGAGA